MEGASELHLPHSCQGLQEAVSRVQVGWAPLRIAVVVFRFILSILVPCPSAARRPLMAGSRCWKEVFTCHCHCVQLMQAQGSPKALCALLPALLADPTWLPLLPPVFPTGWQQAREGGSCLLWWPQLSPVPDAAASCTTFYMLSCFTFMMYINMKQSRQNVCCNSASWWLHPSSRFFEHFHKKE